MATDICDDDLLDLSKRSRGFAYASRPRYTLRMAAVNGDRAKIAQIIEDARDVDKPEAYSFATYYASSEGLDELCAELLATDHQTANLYGTAEFRKVESCQEGAICGAARGGHSALFGRLVAQYATSPIMRAAAYRAACASRASIIEFIIAWFIAHKSAIPWEKFLSGAASRSNVQLLSAICSRMHTTGASYPRVMLCALDCVVIKGNIPTQSRFLEEFAGFTDATAEDWYVVLRQMASYASATIFKYAVVLMPSDMEIDWESIRKFATMFHNAQVIARIDELCQC